MSDVLGLVAGNQELRHEQRTGRKQRGPEGPAVNRWGQGHQRICL